MSTAVPTVPSKRRLVGIDAARGVALLGMMAVHSLYESNADGSPTVSFAIFGGRAAATFAVLAGVGIAFMTGRKRVQFRSGLPVVTGLAVRALAIGAIGLIMGYADAKLAAVILPYYAVLFLLAIPLVFLPGWLVAAVGAAVAAGVPILTHLWLPHLAVPTLDNPELIDLLQNPVGVLTELTITGEYPALSWLAYACAGIVIGRLTLNRLRTAISLLGTGLVMAGSAVYTSWLLLNHYSGLSQIWIAQPISVLTAPETTELLTLGGDGTVPTSTWWWLAVNSPHTGTTPDLVGTTGSAIALLGFMLLLGHITWRYARPVIATIQAPLAAAGGMTLTLYCAHIWFLNSDYDVYPANLGYTLQALAVLLIGLAWRATAGKGPLETLVAGLSGRSRGWVAAKTKRRPKRLPAAPVSPAIPRPSAPVDTVDADPPESVPQLVRRIPAQVAATDDATIEFSLPFTTSPEETTMEMPALRFATAIATAEETTMEFPAIKSEWLLDIFTQEDENAQ
jgi:uncharacterized membrane protein